MTDQPTVVVTGAAGQVGTALITAAAARGVPVRSLTRTDCDIGRDGDVASIALDAGDVLINCAAYTAVDAAETDEAAAHRLNAVAPGLLAERCRDRGAMLIQLSTDYVFGPAPAALVAAPRPWEPDDPTAPSSAYGRTKLAGELAARAADPRSVVVRTAWVYTGVAADGGWAEDFVGTMGRLAGAGTDPKVVRDQTGSPTYAPDLADGLLDLVDLLAAQPQHAGVTLHAAGGGAATWFDLARAAFEQIGADPERVSPCSTAEFPRPAPRPVYSALSACAWTELGLSPLPDWPDALVRALGRFRGPDR